MNEEIVAKIAPRATPIMLKLFKQYHSEGSVGQELLNLFKLWCNYDKCRDIFATQFIPFIMDIVEIYFLSTPNIHNVHEIPSLQSHTLSMLGSANQAKAPAEADNPNVVDSTILMQCLDLLCTLLRRSDKESEDHTKIISVFP